MRRIIEHARTSAGRTRRPQVEGGSTSGSRGAPESPTPEGLCVATFQTDLGWMALAGWGSTVAQITFARSSRSAALAALDPRIRVAACPFTWNSSLARRLREYVAGVPHEFGDVRLDLAHLTPFERRVVKACRAIAYGQTRSYAQVAAAAGKPRAARAVGNTMAANRFALVVPCHRVVHATGEGKRLSPAAALRAELRRLESRVLRQQH